MEGYHWVFGRKGAAVLKCPRSSKGQLLLPTCPESMRGCGGKYGTADVLKDYEIREGELQFPWENKKDAFLLFFVFAI